MLKLGKILGLICIMSIFSLVGCVSFFDSWHKPAAKLPSRHQVCTSLRHQMIFRNNPIGPNMQQSTPIEQARLMKEFHRFNCQELE